MVVLKVCACLLRSFQSCGLLLFLRFCLCLRVLVHPVILDTFLYCIHDLLRCFGTRCLPVLGMSAFLVFILIGCSCSCGCIAFPHLPPVTTFLAPALDQERRWCYGTSSVLSTILVTHAAGSVAWPAGVHSAVETIQ